MSLDEKLSRLPRRPGVYLMKGEEGEILYVGKAKDLRARVRSYFRGEAGHSIKTRELVRRIDDIETLVVGSEAEALILEANLIKEHRPRFNIHLRDDKRYPWIKVTIGEPFPRVFVTRTVRDDGSRYFGPYTGVGPMRVALDVIKRLYTVRSCRYRLPREAPDRPCLDYQIGRCRAPCVGYQTEAEYGEMINEIVRILEGDTAEMRALAESRMATAAEALNFEEAARYRDMIEGLDTLARHQRVQRVKGGDLDVIGVARDGEIATGVVLRVRRGTLLGREILRFDQAGAAEESDLLASVLTRHYLGRGGIAAIDPPAEILIPGEWEDREVFEGVVSERTGRRIGVRRPQRGEKARLLELAATNARHALEDRSTDGVAHSHDRADEVLFDLQERLGLKVVPRLMVCFDISHHQGTDTVASAVVFRNAEPDRKEYRHMKIRGRWGNDDPASMREAVKRWFARRVDEGAPLPELCVVDGGRAQLGVAIDALRELDLGDVHIVALAKREEEVHLPGRREPVRIERRERALHLLQRIRDEAHRFAVSYNRKLRRHRTLRSDLGEIPGVGPRRQQALLSRFGSVRGVRGATEEEIARVPGFSRLLAARIRTWLGDHA
ncbi:MAG: excinuclease ABC subunit UvrC [Longimicrobiales bacterium]|nr:excinuclease ABC subunit UvrC [Longimicrobiales bacterium]